MLKEFTSHFANLENVTFIRSRSQVTQLLPPIEQAHFHIHKQIFKTNS